ncbi:hypothetical protein BDV25DRAFT_127368 [Aspergillus avenaceus]|uniref:Peptidase C14 caspase domain-containing protein n=1 Tax=Aspergillus avenaceus TaxID=36643 RepID=A0A5N6U457_ASPAV|nr:hypothetical protein BDV25DRAFT_127368 [Aspergillus avenaceus]
MAPITFEQFRNTMTAAAAQRGRDYTNVYSLTVRWERDNTQAAIDCDNFQRMLKDLDVTPAVEHIIRRDDSSIVFTFQKALQSFVGKCKAKSESDHNLMILHYAGHGMMKNGHFAFAETRAANSTLDAESWLLNPMKTAQYISDVDRLDVLLIFDCCYAHLAGEVARRKRAGHKYVEFADIFQTLRSRGGKVQPTHSLLVGVASVLLPLNRPGTVDPLNIPPNYTALFSVNVSQVLTTDELRQLSAWMRNLPRFAGLNIDNVYRTQSMCFVLRSALSVYAKLHKLQGYTMIAENPSPPLDLNRLLQPGPSSSPLKKENIPFKRET